MRFLIPLIFALGGVVAFAIDSNTNPDSKLLTFLTTKDRAEEYGYPVEKHTVQTSDAYILTLFRLTNSRKKNCPIGPKAVVFLMHGLLSSSDCWILNGPENSLAYMLADACYDVWLGNARGNTYSKKNAKISPLLPAFWDFSWNEIGLYDLPAMIDYVLYTTDEYDLHYVAHSQGTTAFMVMLSQIPRYNEKIKTSHMLAPVGYMDHMESPLAKVAAPLLGYPTLLSELIGNTEFMPSNKLFSLLGAEACADKSIFQPICGNILFIIAGWDSQHLNYTLLPEVMETHPAGAATNQLIHYLQEYESWHFRKLDHGLLNKGYYGALFPPDYWIQNIRPETPIEFYYSDNDYFASVIDVEHMARDLGKHVNLYHVPYTDWNHLDFLWALEVKEIINNRVLNIVNKYEKEN